MLLPFVVNYENSELNKLPILKSLIQITNVGTTTSYPIVATDDE